MKDLNELSALRVYCFIRPDLMSKYNFIIHFKYAALLIDNAFHFTLNNSIII